MSLSELRAKAASDPELLNRLASATSIQEFLAVAAEVGVTVDAKEFETEELSLDQLGAASGGVRMMMASKMGLGGLGKGIGFMSASADDYPETEDPHSLDCNSTNTEDGHKACADN